MNMKPPPSRAVNGQRANRKVVPETANMSAMPGTLTSGTFTGPRCFIAALVALARCYLSNQAK
jgi:hypothetical protein